MRILLKRLVFLKNFPRNEAEMGKVVIAGGSGFLGQALARSLLGDGWDVILLSRFNQNSAQVGRTVQWNAKDLGQWTKELEGAKALLNLSGRSIDCRHTKKNKEEILNSRINATSVLGEAIRSCILPPTIWLNASTATIYPDRRGDLAPCDETSLIDAPGFSEEVGRIWEKTFFKFKHENVRQIALRISIVLGNEGGAFPVLRKLTKIGLGGSQGPGSQWISWLHIDDWVKVVRFLIDQPTISGPVNLASPKPLTNSDFMAIMREHFAPFGLGLPAPSLAIYFGSIFLGTPPDLILKSRKVISQKLAKFDYLFEFPNLKEALISLSDK